MEIAKGKTLNKKISSVEEISQMNFTELYSHGFTNIAVDFPVEKKYTGFPINFVLTEEPDDPIIKVEGPANFFISKEGKIKFVIVNGFLIEIENPHTENINGEVIRR